MRKLCLVISLLLLHCASPKPLASGLSVLLTHPRPIRIARIGYWPPKEMILTLIDADHYYFVLRIPADDHLKIGEVYPSKK